MLLPYCTSMYCLLENTTENKLSKYIYTKEKNVLYEGIEPLLHENGLFFFALPWCGRVIRTFRVIKCRVFGTLLYYKFIIYISLELYSFFCNFSMELHRKSKTEKWALNIPIGLITHPINMIVN